MNRRELLAGFACLPAASILNQGGKRIECIVELTPAVANLNSVFTLFKPNGTQSQQNAITDTGGRAEVVFRLKGNDPSGVYNGRVDVSASDGQVTDQSSVIV